MGRWWLVALAAAVGCAACGGSGTAGERGQAGSQGNVGATGATGERGPAGDAGATGAAGPVGAMGATGPAGPMGPVGAQGAAGAVGAQGPRGFSGAGISATWRDATGAAMHVLSPGPSPAIELMVMDPAGAVWMWRVDDDSLQPVFGSVSLYYASTDCTGAAFVRPGIGGMTVRLPTDPNPAHVAAYSTTTAAGSIQARSSSDGVTCRTLGPIAYRSVPVSSMTTLTTTFAPWFTPPLHAEPLQ